MNYSSQEQRNLSSQLERAFSRKYNCKVWLRIFWGYRKYSLAKFANLRRKLFLLRAGQPTTFGTKHHNQTVTWENVIKWQQAHVDPNTCCNINYSVGSITSTKYAGKFYLIRTDNFRQRYYDIDAMIKDVGHFLYS